MPIYAKRPQVVLVVGVNGSGKTTTIGKLASQFKAAGKSVVIAAGDTFRAAAVEQLQIWGDRAGVPVLTAPEGSDPASLAFDAMTKAEADGADLLMIDTAGRLQNRADLMEELSKIVRVIRKKDPDAPHNTLLVLDATTGQNALSQVEIFQKLADVSGLVMTKLDGTARGGVLVALADKFGLPIHAIGVGEQARSRSTTLGHALRRSILAPPAAGYSTTSTIRHDRKRHLPRAAGPASHIEAPVVMLWTSPPEEKMIPAARKATPAVTASIRRSGSTRIASSAPKGRAELLAGMNRQAAIDTSICVRRPAGFCLLSRSAPITAPRVSAAISRVAATSGGTALNVPESSLVMVSIMCWSMAFPSCWQPT